MIKNELDLIYNYREPFKKLDKNPLLIMIHGYGSNESDLFSLSQEIPNEFHIVSVRGTQELPFGGYSWYDINFETEVAKKFVDVEQAIESKNKLKNFIENTSDKYNVDKKNIFLMGFSQGAILSYAISLSFPNLVKNIIPMSGYLHKEMIDFKDKEEYKNLDFIVTHGTLDEVILPEWGKKSIDILQENDISFEYKDYKMVHTISPQSFYDIKKWIEERL